MSGRLPQRLSSRVRRATEQMLLSQTASLGSASTSRVRLEATLDQAEARWLPLRDLLDQALALVRFTPRTTVGRALTLHPGVATVLAEHQLDRCEGCPVRHDESLEEVARGHDIPLDQLLSRLDALLAPETEG